jgi:hypothetical protein
MLVLAMVVAGYISGHRDAANHHEAIAQNFAGVRATNCRSAFLGNLVSWHDAERDLRDGRDDAINLATAIGGLRSTLLLCFPPSPSSGPRHPTNLLVDLDNTTPAARLAEIDRLLEVGWERSTIDEPWQGDVP